MSTRTILVSLLKFDLIYYALHSICLDLYLGYIYICIFMLPPTTGDKALCFPVVRPSVNTYFS